MSADISGPEGVAHHHFLRNATALLLISCAAVPATASAAAQAPTEDPNRDILIVAPPLFRDVIPERQLDQDAIDSYAASTIDELLGEVQVELGDEADQPLILVNGKRINDLSEIGALPVEALRNVQVLPRGSAVRAGGTSGQRVINLTLKRQLRSATATAAEKWATDGDYLTSRGEGILTRIKGNARGNITLRARGDGRLLEADRAIIQPTPTTRYTIGGNVVGFPSSTGEIDPALSAIAGQRVTVAPLPSGGPVTLAGLAGAANQPGVTDVGLFRTLRPSARNYELNSGFSAPVTSWLTANATLRWSRNTSDSLRGLPNGLFVLRATNPATPFSRNAGLAYYGTSPLHSRYRRDSGLLNVTLDGTFGAWDGNFNAQHEISRGRTLSDRQSTSTITLADSFNPFITSPTSLIGIVTDRTTSKSLTDLAQLVLNGPALNLPAGPLVATLEGRLQRNRIEGTSTSSVFGNQNISQSEEAVRAAFDIPITSRANHFGDAMGELSATAEIGRAHYTRAGTLGRESFGLTWEPRPLLRLRASYERSEQPPAVGTLGGPVIVSNDVRIFDPLTGQTVDVTQITGGNPDLKPQKTTIKRLNALLRLDQRLNLQLNGEYTDTDRRNFVSSLPEASAAVMLAFPERYVRNGSGVLTTMDLRPVNFASDREKRLRWGFSMNTKLLDGTPAKPAAKGLPRIAARPSTNFQLTANHSMVFSERIVIRDGLPPVDLLGGGAVGIGGGRLRHQIDSTAALTRGGTGIRAGVTWRGPSTLNTRISNVTDKLDFSPVTLINVRAFTDIKQWLPNDSWAKGLRLSLDVINLTNDRQTVRNSIGSTPLQYQKGYRDAFGRTIEFEIRKVF